MGRRQATSGPLHLLSLLRLSLAEQRSLSGKRNATHSAPAAQRCDNQRQPVPRIEAARGSHPQARRLGPHAGPARQWGRHRRAASAMEGGQPPMAGERGWQAHRRHPRGGGENGHGKRHPFPQHADRIDVPQPGAGEESGRFRRCDCQCAMRLVPRANRQLARARQPRHPRPATPRASKATAWR